MITDKQRFFYLLSCGHEALTGKRVLSEFYKVLFPVSTDFLVLDTAGNFLPEKNYHCCAYVVVNKELHEETLVDLQKNFPFYTGVIIEKIEPPSWVGSISFF